MILDKLENQNLYIKLNSNFEKAFKFLIDNDFEKMADGKYEIDSDNIYALVQSYTTKGTEETKMESHKRYIDIQYVAKGEETIIWAPTNELIVNKEYSEEKDVTFYKDALHSSKLNLKEDYFGVFFPNDGHEPCCICDKQSKIKKVVLKIKL